MSSSLTFRRHGSVYALDAGAVLEVVEKPALSSWPGAPVGVAGVMDYRGQVIPVLDVAARIGGTTVPEDDTEQLILVRLPGGTAALLADEALQLVENLGLEPLPHPVPSSLRKAAPFLSGLASTGAEQVVMGLELASLANFPEDRPDTLSLSAPFTGQPSELLIRRARELAIPVAPPEEHQQRQLVVFLLSGERLAVAVGDVTEFIPCPPFTTVPGATSHLLGLAYYRGGLLRLVDIRALCGLDTRDSVPPEVVVLCGSGMATGIVVDAVEAIVSFEQDEGTKLSSGKVRLPYNEGWLTVLDLERLKVREPEPQLEPEP